MNNEEKPDLIVGVDLGQTCTGVSYANLFLGNETIKWIQKWPRRGAINENKVPTMLLYPQNGAAGKDPVYWGFLAEDNMSKRTYKTAEWFKTDIDPEHLEVSQERDPGDAAESYEVLLNWYRDYLRLLYGHIQSRLSPEIKPRKWGEATIEFIFSVPTTWSHPIVEKFRSVIVQAGFDTQQKHTVTIGLTEAEAAAVHTSTEAPGIFNADEILLVCDAGGGTTDLSALRVTDTAVGAFSLKQLKQVDVVDGENIGSAAIDWEFKKFAIDRLHQAEGLPDLGQPAEDIAWTFMKGQYYQNMKCEHGSPVETPRFGLPIPNLSDEYTNFAEHIEHGELMVTKQELRTFFDVQVKKLFRLIDAQLLSLQTKLPDQQIHHLVLSGGLGQSEYVQNALKARYELQRPAASNAQVMQVRTAPDPQLAVCKGLVADRVRKLKVGESVLGWRCCRASYGVDCKEVYDSKNPRHVNRHIEKDPKDGRKYVMNSVQWFVKRGEPVSVDEPITYTFSRKLDPGDPRRVFPTKIVVCHDDTREPPTHITSGVDRLCDIESDLTGADEKLFQEKNKRFWKGSPGYLMCDFDVKVIIGPADLRFELWFNGQKLSKDRPIKVEWATATAPTTAVIDLPVRLQEVKPRPSILNFRRSDPNGVQGDGARVRRGR